MSHYIIIGGGIIGTAVARSLALRKAGEITVLEKEPSVGRHASGRNSGVIHSGINQKPDTLKSRMCVLGSRLMRQYCKKYRVPMVECGTLVIARNQDELARLEELRELGKYCGVEGLRIITAEELKNREPLAKGIGALLSPTGATVDQVALLESLAEDAKELGVKYRFNCKVKQINGLALDTNEGVIKADYIVNCAGLYADRIAHMMFVGRGYRIIPFRGEYMEVENCDIRTMIYQPPDLKFPFLGVHLTRETDGKVIAGPSATLAFGREAYLKEWDIPEMCSMFSSRNFRKLFTNREFVRLCVKNAGISFFKRAFFREIETLAAGIRIDQIKPYRSGIRAQMVDSEGKLVNDILVEKTKSSTHVLNAVSPGFTCSLAFAEYLADKFILS